MNNYIGKNIQALRTDYGISQEDLAAIAQVSQSAISNWECGTNTPRRSAVQRIIHAIPDLCEDDIMSEEFGYARRALRRQRSSQAAYTEVALYGSVAAGNPQDMLAVDDTFPIPTALRQRYPNAYVLKVSGESMNLCLPNGCYALINPGPDVVDGKIYALRFNEEQANIKRVHTIPNGIVLIPESTDPTFKPQIFERNTNEYDLLSVLGQVVWFCAPLDYA